MADTFEDVVKLILDISQFQEAEAQAAASWRQNMADIVKASQSMNNDVIQMLKNIEYEVEKAGQTSTGFGQRVEQTGLTVGRSLRIMASGFAGLGNFQGASLVYGLERISQVAGISTTSIMSLTPAVLGLGAAAAAVALPLADMAAGMAFNKELADMGTLLDNDANEAKSYASDLAVMKEQIVDVSVRFNQDLIPATKAFKEALSSGVEKQDMEEFMQVVGQLATATNTDMVKVVDILTSVRDAYHLTTTQLTAASDVLFSTIDQSKVHFEEYATSLGRVLPVAQEAGVAFGDLNGAFATLNREGETGSQAITALAEFIRKVTNPTKAAAAEFKALGIECGATAFQTRSFTEVIQDMYTKIQGHPDAISLMFPEARAQRAAAALLKDKESVELLGKVTAEVTSRVGIAASASEKAMDNASTNISKLWKGVSDSIQSSGDDLIKMVTQSLSGGPNSTEIAANNVRIAVARITETFAMLIHFGIDMGISVSTGLEQMAARVVKYVSEIQYAYAVLKGDQEAQQQYAYDKANAEEIYNRLGREGVAALDKSQKAYNLTLITLQANVARLGDKNEELATKGGHAAVTTGDLNKALQSANTTIQKMPPPIDHMANSLKIAADTISKIVAAYQDLAAADAKTFAAAQQIAEGRIKLIHDNLDAELEALQKRANMHGQDLKDLRDFDEAQKKFREDEKEMFRQEAEDYNAQVRALKNAEDDKLQAIRASTRAEIDALKSSDDYRKLSHAQQKAMIDDIIAKRDEAIQKEKQGYDDALATLKRDEADKRAEVGRTIQDALDGIDRLEKQNQPGAKNEDSTGGHGSGGTNLGVDAGSSFDVMGNLITDRNGVSYVGGGSHPYDPDESSSRFSGGFTSPYSTNHGMNNQSNNNTTVNITMPTAANPSGLSSSDIAAITKQVQQALQRQAATQTGGSSYPTGYSG